MVAVVADSKVAFGFVAFELVAFEFVAVLEFQLFVDLMHLVQFVPFHNSQGSNSTLEVRSKRQLKRS